MSKDNEELKVTVPLGEVLELIRLANKIECPTVTYRGDTPLEMANEAIKNSMQSAAAIEDILYKWTHKEV